MTTPGNSNDNNDDRESIVPIERINSALSPTSPLRLQGSSRRSEISVPSSSTPIELQSLGVAEEDVDAAAGEEEENANDEEEEAAFHHVLQCLKDATGFDSYEIYLDSLRQDPMYASRSYTDILDGCFPNARTDNGRSGVYIIDVMDQCPVQIDLRCEILSASEASAVLRNPAPGISAQIILWPVDDHHYGDIENLIDVLGVGLQLEPCFFEPLRWMEISKNERFRSKHNLYLDSIGTSVCVAQKFALTQENPVPVILVAGPLHTSMETFNHNPDGVVRDPGRSSSNAAIYGLVYGAPLYDHFNCAGRPHLANVYIRVLSNLLGSDRDVVLTPSDVICACIIPFLQIEIAICKEDLDSLSGKFNDKKDPAILYWSSFRTKYLRIHGMTRDRFHESDGAPTYLYRYRTKLRSWIEYFDNQKCALLGFLSHRFGPTVSKSPKYEQFQQESMSITRESSRLEAELRDYLQLLGSKLALEESRKSIEVSNRQIQEGKRVKVFTILAFFYVPLNLATSIFGMNLQQLTGTGASVGVFLGTAGVALFLTGISWLLIEAKQSVREWLRQVFNTDNSISHEPESHTIAIRLYMIWWLSRNGLFKWMIRTGAGWCILIKSSRGFQQARPDSYAETTGMEDSQASLFVSYIIQDKGPYSVHLSSGDGGWFPRRKKHETPSITGPHGE